MDINDLTVVLANYGQSVGLSTGMAAVPEPGGLLLAVLAAVALWAFAGPGPRRMTERSSVVQPSMRRGCRSMHNSEIAGGTALTVPRGRAERLTG